MSQSALVNRQWWANPSNYTVGRQDTIHGIVVHHAATTSLDAVGATFSQYGRGGSAHYGLKDNEIHQYVHEEDTAWHCGDWPGNSCTIGIETVNSTDAPYWLVSEASFNTLAKLCADVAKRNGLGKVKFEPDGIYPTLSAHRDWSPTYCPGDYLYSRMNELADKINSINYPPAKADLKWEALPECKIYLCDRIPTYLYDFNYTKVEDCKVIKTYEKGTEIEIAGKCTNKTIGKTYLISKYSWDKKITNGFRETHMVEKPEPEPTPEPTPDPDPDPTVGILEKIIQFIQHIIDLITKKKD